MALRDIKRAKNSKELIKDEWYTQYEDIANELNHYAKYFKGKKVICPCDWDQCEYDKNPNTWCKKCNFVRFLKNKQEAWQIKSIDYSGYNPSDPKNNNNLKNYKKFQDVDFSKYDIVVTNPPFSLMIDFIDKLMYYKNLKFIVVGQKMHVLNINIFKYFMAKKLWWGYTHLTELQRPDGTFCRGTKKSQLPSTCFWFTNLPVNYNRNNLILHKYYDPNDYQKYENADILHIERISEIPMDYKDLMAVPVSQWIFDKNRFKIIGMTKRGQFPVTKEIKPLILKSNKREQPNLAYLKTSKEHPKAFYYDEKNKIYLRCPFTRIIVKNLNPVERKHEN